MEKKYKLVVPTEAQVKQFNDYVKENKFFPIAKPFIEEGAIKAKVEIFMLEEVVEEDKEDKEDKK